MDELAVAEVLERAADLIVVDGWMQGGYGAPWEARCAEGHLQSACNEQLPEYRDFLALLDAAHQHIGFTLRALTAWNDKSGRTAGEVRDLFLNTAKDIRNGVDGAPNLKEPSL